MDVSNSIGLDQAKYRAIVSKCITELKRRLGAEFETCWYQQDGAPPHTARATIDYLEEAFGGRLIAKNSKFEWPPNSPDLNPLDYWFWGFVSSLVGPRGDMTRGDLIATACLAINAFSDDKLAIVKAIKNFRLRLTACIEAHGHHFEHFYRASKDRLEAYSNIACDTCGHVHDNCERCTAACMTLWFENFDFGMDDLVEEANLDGEFDPEEVEPITDDDDAD